MASAKDHAITKARELIALLKSDGMEINEAYLFGSIAGGREDADSDIDVAIVSREFSGVPFYDVKKLSKFRRAVDLRLEIHPFSLNEIMDDPPLFFLEIRSKGIPIHLSA
jgi:predicted nucleotidyltransferase